MKKQSRTVPRRRQSVSPTPRHLPLVDILIDTQAELQELVVASGLKVLEAMLDEDRAAVCGPRYAHQPARQASRTGHTPSQVVLGGRKVAIRRPRARRAGEEVPLPPARAFANADPLNRRVVDQMLIGVATRQDARSLDPLGADVTTRGTSKSAVSRRFVAQTQAQLDAWRAPPLDALDLVGLLIDGVHVGGHCIVIARGIDTMGAKHPLGLWEGATENATVCQGLLTNLASRGRRTDRSLALANLGHHIARNTVKRILHDHGLAPAPERNQRTPWKTFLQTHWEGLAAADLFMVEVLTLAGLRRYFVFFVIELKTRRVHIAGIHPQPDGRWMEQMARNLTDPVDGFLRTVRQLIHDCDPLYTRVCGEILTSGDVGPIRLPPKSQNLNAYAERFVRSIKEECLHRVVPLGEGHLRLIVYEYVEHYHRERNHQGLDNQLLQRPPPPVRADADVQRRERLGGLLSFYYREAA